MIAVKVDYNPRLTKGEQAILQIPNRIANLRPVMRTSIAPAANRMFQRHFASKGAAFGHPWAPWSVETLRRRLAKGNASKGILLDTDHLFRALTRRRETDSRLSVVAGRLRLQLNIAVPYAVFHQVGTQFMPERQVIPDPLPRSFTSEVRAIIKDFILTGRVRRAQ